MHLNQRKEQFSIAYVRAVASVAGFAVHKPEVDDDSVDLALAASGDIGTIRSPRLDMQIKCTSREILGADSVAFPLPIKNYDDLRPSDVMVPRILVVVLVPDGIDHWLTHSEEELVMKHCGYWMSLRGRDASNNIESVTVHLPRNNTFTVQALQEIMTRIGRREQL
jgi:hypothetical protein